MSGVGPVEPGEGTHAWDSTTSRDGTRAWYPAAPDDGTHARGTAGPAADTRAGDSPGTDSRAPATGVRARLAPLAHRCAAHRRTAIAVLTAVCLLAVGGLLYATRPHQREPATPQPPFPAQVVDVTYLGGRAVPPGAPPHTLSFEVLLTVESGPPVTVTRVSQPYAGISLTSAPRAPFRTTAGSARKLVITMHVTECGKVPENAGLPFLDVTLRNARAIQVQSFILGPHYAQDLSRALQVACSNDSTS
ncbi:Tat pathway signal sequence domain protein [Streptomyces sp. NPDC002588]|uniref:Tat pathway signal sequence domain protein n=1 Tax=Streptomyces sp. NPDC002588 TaxID=3154419 RepID=UPI0033221237